MFWVLGPSARAAYLPVASDSGLKLTCLSSLRHAETATKRRLTHAFFFRSRGSACAPLSVQQSAADDGRDAPASRPSRPSMAAALARRLGRVGRRLRSKLHGTDRQQPRGAHAKRQTSQKRAGGGDEGDGDWPADGGGAGGRAGDVSLQ